MNLPNPMYDLLNKFQNSSKGRPFAMNNVDKG